MSVVDPGFWRGRRVLLTGHTGFKGSWAALWLHHMGAAVTGLALAPEGEPSHYGLAKVETALQSHLCDLRNAAGVRDVVSKADPELVLHMAAQPLVRRSIADPLPTFEINVQGTANLLEALRSAPALKAVLVVTTDKVYENAELGRPFVESDPLGGRDPYAASKAACEIVTSAMARTYFEPRGIPVATARGGNVIGGGDFAVDRLVPDIIRSVAAARPVLLRYPNSVRPWQHVLDCLGGYLIYLQALARQPSVDVLPRSLNIGPESEGLTVAAVTEAMLGALGSEAGWALEQGAHPHEAKLLTLETRLARETLGWSDRLPGKAALDATATWYQEWAAGADMREVTLRQVNAYLAMD